MRVPPRWKERKKDPRYLRPLYPQRFSFNPEEESLSAAPPAPAKEAAVPGRRCAGEQKPRRLSQRDGERKTKRTRGKK